MDHTASAVDATVYYDGGCPVCRKEISQYERARGAERVRFVDVTNCAPEAHGPGLSRQAALVRMHVRLADGSLESGAAAFAALWQRLPGFAWAGQLARLPAALPVMEIGYQVWLKARRFWRR